MPELDERRPSFAAAEATTTAAAPVWVRSRLDGGAAPAAVGGGGVGVWPSAGMAVGGAAADPPALSDAPPMEPCTPGAGGTTPSIDLLPEGWL